MYWGGQYLVYKDCVGGFVDFVFDGIGIYWDFYDYMDVVGQVQVCGDVGKGYV